ncbi:sensor histidine kinase [Streptomyces sp. NPDC059649]|uniref:sensor histidine kinase n=1 Tax=Streptomyces sp. NPDC059649 TaxID=3346895 RepID=UPI00368B879D
MNEHGSEVGLRPGWGGSAALLWRGVVLTGLALTEALLLVWVTVVVCLACIGVGIPLLAGALDTVRADARLQRRLALEWTGVRVPEPYAPEPHGQARPSGLRRVHRMIGDPATWRDLLWLLINPCIGPVLALLPAVALVHGLFGLVLPFIWQPVVESWDNTWFLFLPVQSLPAAIGAAGLGVVEIVVSLGYLPRLMLPLHGRWVRAVLGTSRTVLSARVDHLTHSRSDAMRMQAGEIRRIERDLHDGAQVRLVALGMTLSAAESLLEENPQAARALLLAAKQDSTKTLNEIRDLVNGVHPPVLADRGLVDAVRTLALGIPLKIQVAGSLPGRLPEPVESAAYFSVAELLANVTKHAGAREAHVDIRHADGALRIAVHDNGGGGADLKKGNGLKGVERRLAVFDGPLAITSPDGGPTTVAFEIPCDIVDASDDRPATM